MALRERRSWWLPEPGLPGPELTVSRLLDGAVADSPEAEAVAVSGYGQPELDVRWSYRELGRRVERMARALAAAGVAAGQPVAVWAPNVPQWLVAEFAVARAGAVLVTVNPTYRSDEVRHVLSDSGAVACLVLPRFGRWNLLGELAPVRSSLPGLRQVISLGEAAPGAVGLAEFLRGADEADGAAVAARAAAVRPGDVAQIQYTSGTTGQPKGAELTHHGLVANARQSAALWQVGPHDRWCNPMPLFHTAGCGMVALGTVAARAAHVPLLRFDADRTLDMIERERCTVLETVPTMLTALLDRQRARGADLSSLRLVGTSGAPTPADLGVRCADEWGVPLRVLYGSTEVSPTVSGTAVGEPGDLGWTTVGRPLPGTEVRVVDPATGAVCQPGVPGELQVRGYQVMRGYHNQPDATAAAIWPGGWYASGDLATMDGAGYLRVTGRLRDMIVRGGENLYPAEIEQVLRQHPAVADAAVIGVPDPLFGEEACAVITVRDGGDVDAELVRAWMRERVTHQKVPRYVRIVDALPQTASGKVQKFLLREQFNAPGERARQ